MRTLLLVLALVACKSDDPIESTPSGSGSGSGSGSAAKSNGFGASLGDEPATGSNKGSAGSVGSAGSGSAEAPKPDSGSGSGSAASGSAEVVKAGSGSGSGSGAGSGSGSGGGSDSTGIARTPIRVPGDIAAIKFELLPNWERDVVEPGSFSLSVKRGAGDPKTFTFSYGYDDPKLPTDHEQYKKALADAKQFTVNEKGDRQRGAAWYLEGIDGNGAPAFRYLVTYGGKRLLCYGTLYKDADSNKLGDIRDEVVIQAKKICESLGL